MATISGTPNEVSTVNKAAVSSKGGYTIPTWAGKSPSGSHLDVKKADQLIQKLLVDEKGYYYFGRDPLQCDFVVEHASCSRTHAVLLFHKVLKKFAIVDLDSSHGTTIGTKRIEPLTPVFIELDTTFYFGASTRRYTLRSKIEMHGRRANREQGTNEGGEDEGLYSSLHNLPEKQAEIDNMTEYNTAQNRRIPQIPITLEEARRKSRKRSSVQFSDEEEVINPEDVDPTVGRFRNLIRTAVIPTSTKRARTADSTATDEDLKLFEFYSSGEKSSAQHKSLSAHEGDDGERTRAFGPNERTASEFMSTMGVNAAPSLELYAPKAAASSAADPSATGSRSGQAPASGEMGVGGKKKYAKEAWPGRKPSML